MNIELLISVGGGLIAAFKWIYEYKKKLQWEQNVYLLQHIETFQNLESTQIMEKLLDWNSVKVIIDGEEKIVNDSILSEAFSTHNFKHSFTPLESKLRGIFDDYFDNLTKLIFMVEVGLVEKNNLILFLEYWLKILSGESKNKPRELINKIHNYMTFYDFEVLFKFIKEYQTK